MEQNEYAAIEEALGSPAIGDLPEAALKVRRNLMAVGFISAFIAFGGATFDTTTPIFGIKFLHVSDEAVRVGLVLTTLYFLLHFGWYAYDAFMLWRIRITGTKLAFTTGAMLGSPEADYPDDPKQSSLYYWWFSGTKWMGSIKEKLVSTEEQLRAAQREIAESQTPNAPVSAISVMTTLNQAQTSFAQLTQKCEELHKLLSNERIPVSLRRFDRWFELCLRSQNARWILIEISLPIVVGLVGGGTLLWKML